MTSEPGDPRVHKISRGVWEYRGWTIKEERPGYRYNCTSNDDGFGFEAGTISNICTLIDIWESGKDEPRP